MGAAVVIALIFGGVYYVKQYTPEYSWWPNYRYDNDQPYGTKYLYELFQKDMPEDSFKLLQKKPSLIIDETETNSLIFYIGYNTFYDSLTTVWLKDYIDKGNSVCIASDRLPFQLINDIYELDTMLFYTEYYESKTVSTSFNSESDEEYNFHYQWAKDTSEYAWRYFSETTMESYWKKFLYTPISVIDNDKPNFLKIQFGQGSLYIFTTPLFLTNYFLISEEGFNYSNAFFNSLGDYEKVYWDDFSRMPNFGFGNSTIDKNNPLEFILENTALRWAWYLFLVGILLFILFMLKRRRKPMKIINADKNTSIEYAKAVGLLHYKTAGHTDLANRLMKIFQHFIHSKYGIGQHLEREDQIKQLSLHSGLSKKRIEAIYNTHFSIKYNPDPEVSATIRLHTELEYFYKNCN